MARRRFSYDERVKMLAAAFEFCPKCQAEFEAYAHGMGTDVITFIREQLWRIWGNWEHGQGCPQPEVPATTAPDAVGSAQTGPAAAAVATLPEAAGQALDKSGSEAHLTGFERDPGVGPWT